MKKIAVIEYSNDTSLISSILFLIFGIILFTNPSGILNFISYIVGGILIVIGVFSAIVVGYKTLVDNTWDKIDQEMSSLSISTTE